MTTATVIKNLRTVRFIPKPGEHQLSVNLGLAEAAIVFEFASEMGFKPEIVQIPTLDGIEIHALLLSESLDESPMHDETSELSRKLDELSARINPDAIRHVYGRLKAA